MIWISLSLFGLILYLIVHNSVSRTTTTPSWVLWLVLMIPALAVGGWKAFYGEQAQPPPQLIIPCALVCMFLYIYLARSNVRTPPSQESTAVPDAEPKESSLPDPQPSSNLLTKGEENQLQNCFPWSIFYLQNVDSRPQVVICRGQLRSQPETAYQTIQENVKTQFGDRFLVVFQAGVTNKPFFVLVPNPQAQERQKRKGPISRPGLGFGLLAMTLLTTTIAGTKFSAAANTSQVLRESTTSPAARTSLCLGFDCYFGNSRAGTLHHGPPLPNQSQFALLYPHAPGFVSYWHLRGVYSNAVSFSPPQSLI